MSSHLHSKSDPNHLLSLQDMHINDSVVKNHLSGRSCSRDRSDTLLADLADSSASSKCLNSRSNGSDQLHNLSPQRGSSFSLPSGIYIVNNSPTHSLSGSSQHSESPIGSSSLGGIMVTHDSRIAPVYENVEYYTQPLSYEHHIGNFESSNKKAQPQVPSNGVQIMVGGRFAHTPQPEVDSIPIYENLLEPTGKL